MLAIMKIANFAMETKLHDGGLDLLIFEAPLALRFGHGMALTLQFTPCAVFAEGYTYV